MKRARSTSVAPAHRIERLCTEAALEIIDAAQYNYKLVRARHHLLIDITTPNGKMQRITISSTPRSDEVTNVALTRQRTRRVIKYLELGLDHTA